MSVKLSDVLSVFSFVFVFLGVLGFPTYASEHCSVTIAIALRALTNRLLNVSVDPSMESFLRIFAPWSIYACTFVAKNTEN